MNATMAERAVHYRSMQERDLRAVLSNKGFAYSEGFERTEGFILVYGERAGFRTLVGPKDLILSMSLVDFARSDMYLDL